jgi:hypothetical protein
MGRLGRPLTKRYNSGDMMTDGPKTERIVCPGCGGRNDPAAHSCEWCGRLFVAERRKVDARVVAPAGIAAVVLIAMTAVVFALLGSRSASHAPVPSQPAASVDFEDDDEEEIAADPTTTSTPTLLALATAAATTTPRVEFVRIFNTGGAGAFLRREARPGAPGIVAYRDGTVLRIVGADTTSEGRVWRNVEDRQGNRGWTPRDYLEPSDTGF